MNVVFTTLRLYDITALRLYDVASLRHYGFTTVLESSRLTLDRNSTLHKNLRWIQFTNFFFCFKEQNTFFHTSKQQVGPVKQNFCQWFKAGRVSTIKIYREVCLYPTVSAGAWV